MSRKEKCDSKAIVQNSGKLEAPRMPTREQRYGHKFQIKKELWELLPRLCDPCNKIAWKKKRVFPYCNNKCYEMITMLCGEEWVKMLHKKC